MLFGKKPETRNISIKYKSIGHRQFETVLFNHTGDNINRDA